MNRTVPWPAGLVWELVGHSSKHLGGITHGVAGKLCDDAAVRLARARRTREALKRVLAYEAYSPAVQQQLTWWHDDLIEYANGLLDGTLPFAEALRASINADADLWQRYDDFRFSEAVQREISNAMFDAEFGQ